MTSDKSQNPEKPTHKRKRLVRRAVQAVREYVRVASLWAPSDKVVVACSGGLDSSACLAILCELRPSLGHGVAIAHIDHGLRPGGAERDVVTELGRRYGVEVLVRELQLGPGANLQGRARDARYQALGELTTQLRGDALATAHHSDDQAETFLMRASRGCGHRELEGVQPSAGRVVRPLLTLDRQTLQTVADEWELPIASDPTNADRRHTRNEIRHDVLPLLNAAISGASAGLARTAANLRSSRDEAGHWLNVALDHLLVVVPLPADDRANGSDALCRWQIERRYLPESPPLLRSCLTEIARRAGQPGLTHKATDGLILCIRQQTSEIVLKQTVGLHWEIGRGTVAVTALNIARPQGAD